MLNLKSRDNVTPVLHVLLYWLPVTARIDYKICLLVHKTWLHAVVRTWPLLLMPVANIPSRLALGKHSTEFCLSLNRVPGTDFCQNLNQSINSLINEMTKRISLRVHKHTLYSFHIIFSKIFSLATLAFYPPLRNASKLYQPHLAYIFGVIIPDCQLTKFTENMHKIAQNCT